MSDLTAKGLAETLVSKHEGYIKKYSTELEAGQRVSVLREKMDLLKFWIADEKSGKKHVSELAAVEDELKKLESSGLLKPQSYYSDLKKKIAEHVESKDYWEKKIGELSS